ncbi:MAG: hypothetical protein B6D73_01225 [gamma proteobacterium symbiont of Stewartia floridana]|nr:MAG: hypothetical protein B6D73_01225 [gamma proteobacterium symbiont of Stewartia floridana]
MAIILIELLHEPGFFVDIIVRNSTGIKFFYQYQYHQGLLSVLNHNPFTGITRLHHYLNSSEMIDPTSSASSNTSNNNAARA